MESDHTTQLKAFPGLHSAKLFCLASALSSRSSDLLGVLFKHLDNTDFFLLHVLRMKFSPEPSFHL